MADDDYVSIVLGMTDDEARAHMASLPRRQQKEMRAALVQRQKKLQREYRRVSDEIRATEAELAALGYVEDESLTVIEGERRG